MIVTVDASNRTKIICRIAETVTEAKDNAQSENKNTTKLE